MTGPGRYKLKILLGILLLLRCPGGTNSKVHMYMKVDVFQVGVASVCIWVERNFDNSHLLYLLEYKMRLFPPKQCKEKAPHLTFSYMELHGVS